jgi:hypothetical protein
LCDAIIAGPYVDRLNPGRLWRGSANQRLVILRELGQARCGQAVGRAAEPRRSSAIRKMTMNISRAMRHSAKYTKKTSGAKMSRAKMPAAVLVEKTAAAKPQRAQRYHDHDQRVEEPVQDQPTAAVRQYRGGVIQGLSRGRWYICVRRPTDKSFKRP